ncbi:MAG: hypothetical protein H7Z37_15985, partial [Pyrinomonadaceae bacterium]|nr:hypothetical protein [Pyrinomonadaceae bacterium]
MMHSLRHLLEKSLKQSILTIIVFALSALLAHAQRPTPTPQISGSSQTSQGSRYGQAGFVGEPINLNVVNADVRDILNYITEQYGVNFVIDKSVKQVPVTVNVNDVPWNIALDAVLQSNGLGVDVTGSILRIADAKVLADESSLRRQNEENRLDTSQLYTEFIRLNYARAGNSLAGQAGSTGTFQGGDTSGSSTGGDAGSGGILPIIKRRLSRRGSVEVADQSNSLIITDVRQNIDAIKQLVVLLDQPEPQVEIEARIVIASRNFTRDLGVQLSAVSVGGNGAGGIFSTLPGAANNSGIFTGGGTPPGAGLEFPQPTSGSSGLGATAASTILGLTTGVFGTTRINALLTAAESKGQVKIVASPRVTTLNNRP